MEPLIFIVNHQCINLFFNFYFKECIVYMKGKLEILSWKIVDFSKSKRLRT